MPLVVNGNLLCLPPSVTGEVYCFPRRQQIFIFGRRIIYHSKGLWEYIPKSIQSLCLSVCTTIFERIAGLSFYLKVWCCTSMDSSQRALQINVRLFFQIRFRISVRKPNNIQTERCEFWSKCNMLNINGFVSTSATN